jgi:uncharacterized membrane protein
MTAPTTPVRRPSARPGKQRREILAHPAAHHPAVVALAERHAANAQLRVAGAITAFAGSMRFVYVHIVLFALWMLFFEKSPWPTLTLVVSLEAIFLSTFVMIGQNRQATFQQEKADHDFTTQEKELDENTVLTREIHRLTVELHALQAGTTPS